MIEDVGRELLTMEKEQFTTEFKFGILYAAEGQTTENEFFGNEKGSAAFDKFLELMGTKVELKGFNKFRGGLDTVGMTWH